MALLTRPEVPVELADEVAMPVRRGGIGDSLGVNHPGGGDRDRQVALQIGAAAHCSGHHGTGCSDNRKEQMSVHDSLSAKVDHHAPVSPRLGFLAQLRRSRDVLSRYRAYW